MFAFAKPSTETAARPGGSVLLPSNRFFVRRIPLVAGQDAVAQVELALETIGPFTPGQLYYGYCPSRDGTQALVFAAYRKSFSAADTSGWATAPAVLPEFAVWLGQAAAVPASLWLHERDDGIAVLAWDGKSELPAGLLARETTAESREKVRAELIDEARRRFDSGTGAPKILAGIVGAGSLGKEGLTLSAGEKSTLLSPAQLGAIDVRDKAELAGQLARQKHDRLLWLGFASAVAALAACVVIEAGVQLSNLLLTRQRRQLQANVAAVEEIQRANQLVLRMDNLAGQSLRPLEMLAVLNDARPVRADGTYSLEFIRAQTQPPGSRQMEIEAQSSNAADPEEYRKNLVRTPSVEKVESRDFRTSGGKTTFFVMVTFKPGFAGQGGAR